jgi:hypothetical protein
MHTGLKIIAAGLHPVCSYNSENLTSSRQKMYINYLPNPWGTVLYEEMITTQPVKKFFGFYGKLNFLILFAIRGVRDAYNPKGRVFGSHRVIGIFHGFIPSSRTMVLGSTQATPAMNMRGISCGVKPVGAWG